MSRETASLIAVLTEREGATTAELAVSVQRRRADVLAELTRLKAAGLVERVREPHGRAWNRHVWHVANPGPGPAWEQRQVPGTLPPVSRVGRSGGSVSESHMDPEGHRQSVGRVARRLAERFSAPRFQPAGREIGLIGLDSALRDAPGLSARAIGGALSGSCAVPACRAPEAHRRFRWQTPHGRELCALCAPPAVATALRADALVEKAESALGEATA